jgi:anaerobic selenocysteine-containing dehydrogenase
MSPRAARGGPWRVDKPLVNPRSTHRSALADAHGPLRAGSDIAFLAGLINYNREHDKLFWDHVLGTARTVHHMLRAAKVTSPMSVGTWLLTAYGPLAGVAAAARRFARYVPLMEAAASGRLESRVTPAKEPLAGQNFLNS